MGVRVKDYLIEIENQKQEAVKQGKSELILKARELHAKCKAEDAPSLIQCCAAMRQSMLEGDEIINNKVNKSGASVVLTIRYKLENMETRAKCFQPHRRGRPAGSKNKSNKILNALEINESFEHWMRRHRMKFENYQDAYLIDDSYGYWIIAKYQEESERDRFIHSLQVMGENTYKCSVLFKDTKRAHNFWEGMSEEVIDRLNLSAFFIDDHAKISYFQ